MTEGSSDDRPADKDQIKPFHAREVATGQETADVVAAVLKHAQARDEAAKKKTAPKPQPIWMLPLGLTMAVLATFLLIAPPPWVVVNPIAAQAPEEQVRNTSASMVLLGNRIETYRIANGRLPQTLAEAGIPAIEGIDYSPQGETYLLIVSAGDGEPVVYNSASESMVEWGLRMAGDVSRRIGG